MPMPSPERAIAEIITTKWNATAQLATDVPGRLHWELYQMPSDGSATTRPYCVFDMPASTRYRLMAGTTEEVIIRNVRFQVYGLQSEVYPAIDTIRDTFNRSNLGGVAICCVPADGGQAVVEMWQRDGEQVWKATIVFKVTAVLS